MAVELPEPEDTEMNMTPMIDIVFQLIVFFMLTLKFKTVEERIETALPKDRGIQATQQFVDDLPLITVKLFRENIGDKDNAYTIIRIGNKYTINLPKGEWTGEAKEDAAKQVLYDAEMRKVVAAIADIWGQQGNNPEIKGEIKTPRPKGTSVPHGDVVRVLDAFLEVGVTDVKFEGTPPPLPEGG